LLVSRHKNRNFSSVWIWTTIKKLLYSGCVYFSLSHTLSTDTNKRNAFIYVRTRDEMKRKQITFKLHIQKTWLLSVCKMLMLWASTHEICWRISLICTLTKMNLCCCCCRVSFVSYFKYLLVSECCRATLCVFLLK